MLICFFWGGGQADFQKGNVWMMWEQGGKEDTGISLVKQGKKGKKEKKEKRKKGKKEKQTMVVMIG